MDTQLELPFTLEDCGGMDAVYIDQGMRRSWGFFSAYTPFGIKLLDKRYCDRIVAFDGDDTAYNELRAEIIHDPHLHQVIKNNLIQNLERVRNERLTEAVGFESQSSSPS